jgi:hypothetical protein
MLTRRLLLPVLGLLPIAVPAAARVPAPKDAYLYIIWPNNNDRIKGAFWCRFGLRSMGVSRAGDSSANVGHHHLLIDCPDFKTDKTVNYDDPIPQDSKHLHFGVGQTEARIELPPGKHTLQLVLGDGEHVPFDPPIISRQITILVV